MPQSSAGWSHSMESIHHSWSLRIIGKNPPLSHAGQGAGEGHVLPCRARRLWKQHFLYGKHRLWRDLSPGSATASSSGTKETVVPSGFLASAEVKGSRARQLPWERRTSPSPSEPLNTRGWCCTGEGWAAKDRFLFCETFTQGSISTACTVLTLGASDSLRVWARFAALLATAEAEQNFFSFFLKLQFL